ncbi:unnamed protein product [Trifolium pratense]|uniref:Uncharacterized protein n=1 Tax=Trifolium pratense TaxID=57577 RepID=A0ACB0J834_TRIPR|nr:unnamed protein product [Trifolium pratense]
MSAPQQGASSVTPKFHPALSVNNVKTLIPITLDLESGQYHSWSALFKVQARVHDVLDHIIIPTEEKEKASYEKIKADDPALWKRLDAVVLQWIYATVSTDILTSILIDDDSAENAWKSVAALFQDNKNSRAMYLHKEFTNTQLADFSTTNAYCNRLKSLADQLANVGAPVNDHNMVLKMLQGLTEQYSNFVTVMQNKKTLPTFPTARSKLALEETTLSERAKQESGSTALVAKNYSIDDGSPSQTPHQSNNFNTRAKPNKNRNNTKNRNKGNNGGGGQSGGSAQSGGGRSHNRWGGNTGGRGQSMQQHWSQPPWWAMIQAPWAMPPCPYPTQQWAQPPQSRQPGVLGSRPQQQQQAYAATAPTDIESALHTMSLSQPDPDWYMDTGATSHMTSTQDGDASNAM